MNDLKFDDLKNFLDSYFNQLKIKILVQGNMTKDHAVSIGNMVVDNLSAGHVIDASEIEVNCRQIKVGNTCLKIKTFMNNDKNTATSYAVNMKDDNLLLQFHSNMLLLCSCHYS